MQDLIIIGASAAGMSAAIYAARAGLDFLLIGKGDGGNTAKAGLVENYLGFPKLSGLELLGTFKKHLEEYQVKIIQEEVQSLKKEEVGFLIKTDKQEHQAKTVLIATGANPKKINIPGEKEFFNKGISYCETCDGPLFSGKNVAVIGSGNSAVKAALSLSKTAKEVFILSANEELKTAKVYLDSLSETGNIKIIYQTNTFEFFGDNVLEGLRYKDLSSNEDKELRINGAFIYIGLNPNSGFIDKESGILNERNEITTDKLGKTKVPGLFAAGDVTDGPYRQISIAVGEGTKAALSVIEYLAKTKI